ncbi:hypothetical protein Q5530_13230 [Saccharothrix sp. BKS2]|uniref:hypothetical protein n=1 Tax=Saccharothrix sp. BKS2 TaxID=3064400 RepID=UPI0039ECCEFC
MTSNNPITELLELRPWLPSNLGEPRALAAVPEVVRYVGASSPWNGPTVRGKHEAAPEHWRSAGFGWLGPHDGSGGVRRAGVVEPPVGGGVGRGCAGGRTRLLDRAGLVGRGYATEATRAVVAEVLARGLADRVVGHLVHSVLEPAGGGVDGPPPAGPPG